MPNGRREAGFPVPESPPVAVHMFDKKVAGCGPVVEARPTSANARTITVHVERRVIVDASSDA